MDNALREDEENRHGDSVMRANCLDATRLPSNQTAVSVGRRKIVRRPLAEACICEFQEAP